MLDKSIPYTGVLMINENPAEYPRFELPAGFLISGYQPGFEFAWADLHMEIEQFETRAEGVQMYRREFFTHPERQKENCLFVIDEEDQVAAVGALWTGDHFGRTLPRIHWIAAHPRHQGKGLVKALLTRLMDLHTAADGGAIYLVTQTWSYKAIHLYKKFGFEPYLGPKPLRWQAEHFEQQNTEAWALIERKLAEYKRD